MLTFIYMYNQMLQHLKWALLYHFNGHIWGTLDIFVLILHKPLSSVTMKSCHIHGNIVLKAVHFL